MKCAEDNSTVLFRCAAIWFLVVGYAIPLIWLLIVRSLAGTGRYWCGFQLGIEGCIVAALMFPIGLEALRISRKTLCSTGVRYRDRLFGGMSLLLVVPAMTMFAWVIWEIVKDIL